MRRWWPLLLIAVVVALPLLLRREADVVASPDATLVIISPHNEAIRYEFTRGFREWYRERTGEVVELDWRIPGGTSEIVRYINAQFAAARELAARRGGDTQGVGIGVDIFFGGGSFEHIRQAGRGNLAVSRVMEAHPEWFAPESIPQSYAGETLYDEQGRWVGAVVSGFGLIYNRPLLRALGFEEGAIEEWADLADPRLFGQVAVADPTKSGSITKCFEMIVQVRMLRAVEAAGPGTPEEAAVARGWTEAMRLIQKIAANGRYFTDSATKPVFDVAGGDCAAGMAIDFYGRFQQQTIQERVEEGDAAARRFVFHLPRGQSTVSADPVAILKGAPNRELAEQFVAYVMSLEGQQLWGYRAGLPEAVGGPARYTLRRSPIRRELYEPPHAQYLADREADLYRAAEGFVYHGGWTGPLFNVMRFTIKAAFINPHPELQEAWGAIIAARRAGRGGAAARAEAVMADVSAIDYEAAKGRIRDVLGADEPLAALRLEAELTRRFAAQYREAAQIARGE